MISTSNAATDLEFYEARRLGAEYLILKSYLTLSLPLTGSEYLLISFVFCPFLTPHLYAYNKNSDLDHRSMCSACLNFTEKHLID